MSRDYTLGRIDALIDSIESVDHEVEEYITVSDPKELKLLARGLRLLRERVAFVPRYFTGPLADADHVTPDKET